MRSIIVLLDNIRSAHNVGSILRTADGLGINKVIMCGITPYPIGQKNDTRLPHVAKGADKLLHKTALGAQHSVEWEYIKDVFEAIEKLKKTHTITAVEQSENSISLQEFANTNKSDNIALIMGTEVDGISNEVLDLCDAVIEIPMLGQKESFNVSVTAAIVMYELAKA